MSAMPPELREDRGEIEAALEGTLPVLIETEDLRGDLHAHTDWSDGKSTSDEMVQQALRLGYEYIALTDHSPSERVAHGLHRRRLEQKMEEVELLRKSYSKPHDGSRSGYFGGWQAGYPDDILARLDIVISAIHSTFRQTRDRITGRLVDAACNRYVDVLAHPTSRLLGSREPLEIDLE